MPTKARDPRCSVIGMLLTGDFKLEHEIYREDAVLDYPQSGERIRGRHNIQESRFIQPNKKRFTVGSAVTCASAFRGAHRLDRRNVKLLQGLECG